MLKLHVMCMDEPKLVFVVGCYGKELPRWRLLLACLPGSFSSAPQSYRRQQSAVLIDRHWNGKRLLSDVTIRFRDSWAKNDGKESWPVPLPNWHSHELRSEGYANRPAHKGLLSG